MSYRYNYVVLTESQIRAYLARIGLDDLDPADIVLDRALLDRLIEAHQMSVPFENLDVYDQRLPISLDVQDLFEKVVIKRRGGYCFELNGLFVSLLRSLGYHAWSCLCRVVRGKDQIRSISHRGTIVEIQGIRYFCDVGFGGPMPCGSVELVEQKEQIIYDDLFWLENQHNGWWNLWRRSAHSGLSQNTDEEQTDERENEQIELMFQEALADPSDFAYLNIAMYANPESYFRVCCMANIRTETGHRNLTDWIYTEKDSGQISKLELHTEQERRQILREKFGIIL